MLAIVYEMPAPPKGGSHMNRGARLCANSALVSSARLSRRDVYSAAEIIVSARFSRTLFDPTGAAIIHADSFPYGRIPRPMTWFKQICLRLLLLSNPQGRISASPQKTVIAVVTVVQQLRCAWSRSIPCAGSWHRYKGPCAALGIFHLHSVP